jgi:hypothetical protein
MGSRHKGSEDPAEGKGPIRVRRILKKEPPLPMPDRGAASFPSRENGAERPAVVHIGRDDPLPVLKQGKMRILMYLRCLRLLLKQVS